MPHPKKVGGGGAGHVPSLPLGSYTYAVENGRVPGSRNGAPAVCFETSSGVTRNYRPLMVMDIYLEGSQNRTKQRLETNTVGGWNQLFVRFLHHCCTFVSDMFIDMCDVTDHFRSSNQ